MMDVVESVDFQADNPPSPPSTPDKLKSTMISVQTVSSLASKYTRQQPISVLVGPDEDTFFIHAGLAVAKSPFFRARLKHCWSNDKAKVEIRLPDISTKGFEVVLDWMYSGVLPSRVTQYTVDMPDYTSHSYKAADVLMMVELQNDLIRNDAALCERHDLDYHVDALREIYDDLHHTKYYQFMLKSVVKFMMGRKSIEWNETVRELEDSPKIMADLLTSTRAWIDEPWFDFPTDDLSEFFVAEPDHIIDVPEPIDDQQRVEEQESQTIIGSFPLSPKSRGAQGGSRKRLREQY